MSSSSTPAHKSKKFKKDAASTLGSFSKNLLGLKFMQRAKEQLVAKKDNQEDEDDDNPFDSNIQKKPQYILNPSYQFCEKLRFGRFSYQGMNLDVETLMAKSQLDNQESHKRKQQQQQQQ